jgi:hypothetical protein
MPEGSPMLSAEERSKIRLQSMASEMVYRVFDSHDACEKALEDISQLFNNIDTALRSVGITIVGAQTGTHTRKYLHVGKRVLELVKALRAAEARIQQLEAALRSIVDLQVPQFDHPPEEWAKHTPETCEECKRWRDMKHPLQHSCDGWYRLLYSRKNRIDRDQENQHWTMRTIAREALAQPAAPEALPNPPGSLEDDLSEMGLTLYCGACRTRMTPHAFSEEGRCPICGNGTVQEMPPAAPEAGKAQVPNE